MAMVPVDDDLYKHGHSCLVPILLIIVALCVGGYFYLRHIGFDFSKYFPQRHKDVQIIDPTKVVTPPKPVERPKPIEEVKPVVPEPEPEPEEPPPKTMAELKAEADAAQKTLDVEIAKAREANKGREIKTFAGVRFGKPMEGSPIKTEKLVAADGTNGAGSALLMFGPKLKTPFRKFANPPLVRVTPKTRRIFQMEFTQPIERQSGWTCSAETTNLVAILAAKLKCQPYALDYSKYPLGDHTFVFPLGETTLTVGEYGGEQLKLTIEHAAGRALAKKESEMVHKEELADDVLTRPLTSDKYPNGGMVKFGRTRVRNGTPRAFCGVVFGSLPPYSAKVSSPGSSTPTRQFYIDYRKTKCKPFMTFDHGQVEISAINGAALAVSLYSDGSGTELSDAEFFRRAKAALEKRFKVKPVGEAGKDENALQNLTYEVVDLKITLGPDLRGGFYLKAVNTALKAAW